MFRHTCPFSISNYLKYCKTLFLYVVGILNHFFYRRCRCCSCSSSIFILLDLSTQIDHGALADRVASCAFAAHTFEATLLTGTVLCYH